MLPTRETMKSTYKNVWILRLSTRRSFVTDISISVRFMSGIVRKMTETFRLNDGLNSAQMH